MNRYLIIVLLFLATHVFAQQNSYNKSYKKIDLFSKFDEKLTFGLSDSEIKLFFKNALRLNNLNFEEEGYRYFLSVSHGWKKNKSEPYKINNFIRYLEFFYSRFLGGYQTTHIREVSRGGVVGAHFHAERHIVHVR